MEPFRGQVGHPDGLTFDACYRQSSTITATCAVHGDRVIEPDHARHRAIWTRRLPLLFNEGKLVCADCRSPFAALRVEGRRNGLGESETLGRWER